MNVEEFLSHNADLGDRVELLDGVPVALPDHDAKHSRILVNIIAETDRRLSSCGCEVFGEGMYLRIDDQNLLAPNAAVYCDRAELDGPDDVGFLCKPSVIFIILIPHEGSRESIRRAKFKTVTSVQTIVVIEPDSRSFTQYERDADVWSATEKPYGSALQLKRPAITLESDELFRRTNPRMGPSVRAATKAR